MGFSLDDFWKDFDLGDKDIDWFLSTIKTCIKKSARHQRQAALLAAYILNSIAEHKEESLLNVICDTINDYADSSETFILTKRNSKELVQAGYLPDGIKIISENATK